MNYNQIISSVEDGVMTITINRADKMNALNKEVLSELKDAVSLGNKNSDIYGIIITGAGEKAFVAGADIAEFSNYTPEQGRKMGENGHDVLNTIEQCGKPVIAAINGFALGGGCELAMACHIRVATPNAKFGQPEVNLGIIPGYGGTQRLTRLIGQTKAMELMLTGDMIKAEEALNLGLLNYVVEQPELLSKCREILDKTRTKAPVAIAKVIKCVLAYDKEGVDGFNFEIDEFGGCFETEDFKEGTTAFLNKRKANFSGK